MASRIKPFPAILLLFLCFTSCVPRLTFRDSWSGEPRYTGEIGEQREGIIITARKYLGVRYRSGGDTPAGFDCSGFVRYVFEQNGIALPRSAKRQFSYGRKVIYEEMRPGDLLFFRIDGATISHVAIYVGGNRFIHAPSSGKQVSYSTMRETYWQQSYAGSVSVME